MVRISKKDRNKNVPRKRQYRIPAKTGALKDNLPKGFKEHTNALNEAGETIFIPKIK